MATYRPVLDLLPHEHNILRSLVEAERVPDGQFIRRWAWFCNLVATFNEIVEKSYSAEDVHHYIMTLRKRPANRLPRWEAWGDGCARMPGIAYSLLSASERKDLTEVYKVLAARTEVGSDSILVNPAHRRELARLFAARTGRGINDRDLIAALIDLRKEGLLPTVGDLPRPTKRRRKFDDFDQAEGMA